VARIGAHMSIAGGHHLAIRAAHRVGFTTVQVFTKSNNQWKAKPLTDADLSAFRDILAETGVVNPIGHNSYLINMASPDDALWTKSIDAMTLEVERGEALGLTDLVAHPGSHVGSGEDAGLTRIASALDEVHRRTAGVSIRIALETTAGQGSNLGHRFEHLGTILARVSDPARLAVCADTCHVFAAGYPLGTAHDYNRTITDLENAVGLDRVTVWHVNDSVRELGSRVDRHAAIGQGRIGLAAFGFLLNDSRFSQHPLILETPKSDDGTDDLDILNLSTLRGLIANAS
jgi:deoxyribonuclease IV